LSVGRKPSERFDINLEIFSVKRKMVSGEELKDIQ